MMKWAVLFGCAALVAACDREDRAAVNGDETAAPANAEAPAKAEGAE